MRRHLKKLFIIPLLSLSLVFMAIAPPDTFTQITARAYGSMQETGDLTLLIHYDIDYTVSLPAESATDTIMAAWSDSSAGSIVKVGAPLSYVASGYGQGAVTVYFSAAEVTAAGIAWNDADFSLILGNPSFFAAPPFNSTAVEWRAESGKSAIAADVVSLGSSIQGSTRWVAAGKTLVDGGVLTADGESYFEQVIPNLRSIAPTLYSGSLVNPDFYERDFGYSYRDELDNYWSGTALANSWDSMSAWTSLPVVFLKVLFTLLITGLCSYYVVRFSNAPLIIIPVAGTIFAAATIINWVPLQLTAILGFTALLIIGYALWLKRAT